jgi:hypothetical protein
MSLPSAKQRNKRNSGTRHKLEQEPEQKKPQETAKKTEAVPLCRMFRFFREGKRVFRFAAPVTAGAAPHARRKPSGSIGVNPNPNPAALSLKT